MNENNPDLALTPTPIPPSDQERAAIALVMERFSDAAIDARVKALTSSKDVQRQNRELKSEETA